MKPIDISKYRQVPDDDQVYTDENGLRWAKFVIEYTDRNGDRFCFDIHATSQVDAERRLEAIASNGVVSGMVMERIESDGVIEDKLK